jgi:hypothetical protein
MVISKRVTMAFALYQELASQMTTAPHEDIQALALVLFAFANKQTSDGDFETRGAALALIANVLSEVWVAAEEAEVRGEAPALEAVTRLVSKYTN